MIELIFAIVIIAITVVSLPMMSQINQRGIENNIVQEVIFASSAELVGATAGYWDENSMQDANVTNLSRVINISGDCDPTTKLRPGHINQPYHRRCLDNNTTPANNAAGGVFYDLDDAEHGAANIYTDNTTDAAGYKDTYNSTIDVSPSATNANVKVLTVTVTDSDDGHVVTVLRTQSANVGETDYYKRMF